VAARTQAVRELSPRVERRKPHVTLASLNLDQYYFYTRVVISQQPFSESLLIATVFLIPEPKGTELK
jgi:hypothetical protein